MPSFVYKALDSNGAERTGSVSADDLRGAATAMRERGMLVLSLVSGDPQARLPTDLRRETGSVAPRTSGGSRSKELVGVSSRATLRSGLAEVLCRLLPVRTQDRVLLLRHLALMLRSGLTLVDALASSVDQAERGRVRKSLERVVRDIEGGASFAQAIFDEREVFPLLVSRLIEASEVSGEMEVVLDRAADHLERGAELKAKLVTSLTYPLVVLLLSFATAGFLVVKVIPKFTSFLLRKGAALPYATQKLVDVSEFFVQHGPAFLAATGVVLIAAWLAWIHPRGRVRLDRAAFRVPLVGGLLIKSAMSQMSWTLAILLNSGLPLLGSLRIVAASLGNRHLSERFYEAADQVLAGRDFATSIRGPAVPDLVVQVVAVGERTGSLSEVLLGLGTFYEGRLGAAVQRMSAMIEPLMILIVGGMVGFVYYAFFMAVIQIVTS